jgi:hypothetical protein
MYFFYFWPNKIHISSTDVVSYFSPPRFHLFSDRCRHTVAPCHTSFPWNQDELVIFASSSDNVSSQRLPWAKIKALNTHHCRQPPSLYNPTSTLYSYKKSYQSCSLSPPPNYVSILIHSEVEHHIIKAPLTVIILFHRSPTSIISLHNDTHSDKIADSLSLFKQFINMFT